MFIYGTPVTAQQWFGYAIALCGIFWYQRDKFFSGSSNSGGSSSGGGSAPAGGSALGGGDKVKGDEVPLLATDAAKQRDQDTSV
jgi:drug/metabolite transporter (DMT)-like permease